MKKSIIIVLMAMFTLININAFSKPKRFGERVCADPRFDCYKVKRGDSWKKLFPNADARDVVQRLNRINMRLRTGWTIAIPKKLSQLNYFDVVPFPLKRAPNGQKTIIVSLNRLAWAAYDEDGELVHWGPASGGRGWCKDVNKPCRTHTGHYNIYRKQGYSCISSKFPLPTGGAAMPFCMHYFKAFALHGSFEVPGYNASHGCIRLFINDARWLNYDFTDHNTKVIVEPY